MPVGCASGRAPLRQSVIVQPKRPRNQRAMAGSPQVPLSLLVRIEPLTPPSSRKNGERGTRERSYSFTAPVSEDT